MNTAQNLEIALLYRPDSISVAIQSFSSVYISTVDVWANMTLSHDHQLLPSREA